MRLVVQAHKVTQSGVADNMVDADFAGDDSRSEHYIVLTKEEAWRPNKYTWFPRSWLNYTSYTSPTHTEMLERFDRLKDPCT